MDAQADTSATVSGQSAEPTTILFRPSKKRKTYRQRTTDDADDVLGASNAMVSPPPAPACTALPVASIVPSTADGDEVEGTRTSMAEIHRLRKQRKQRVGGVEFRSMPSHGHEASHSTSLVLGNDGVSEAGAVAASERAAQPAARFARQTGLVGDVDRHMMAYIDSELAKRRQAASSKDTTSSFHERSYLAGQQAESNPQEEHTTERAELQRQPATMGKIQEIDIGKLEDGRSQAAPKEAKAKRIRLGPDGKPWRGRKRRGSDDIKRDSIVEQVLRENRIDMYEEPTVQPAALSGGGGDGENDDRIAEEFRREFLDSVSQKQKKKAPPPPVRGPGGKVEEELKGPKLGGSRSARAKMHAELKSQKK